MELELLLTKLNSEIGIYGTKFAQQVYEQIRIRAINDIERILCINDLERRLKEKKEKTH